MIMTSHHIHKYQALGNDMLVIDPATFPTPLTPNLIRRICKRHFGVGADGICYGPLPHSKPALVMRFFNPDGSEAEKSGNGLRIFARYLWDSNYANGRQFEMWINQEPISVTIEDQSATNITTTLGTLSFSNPFTNVSLREIFPSFSINFDIPSLPIAVNIGNPHCVLFTDSISAERVKEIGPLLETADPFPNRTNVQIVKAIDEHTLNIEIWERGAGYTLASGTSATAAAGAAIYDGRCHSPVTVHMAGGTATVTVTDQWLASLTGSVQPVFSAILAPPFLTP
jgi:diaminopimelate epimerase